MCGRYSLATSKNKLQAQLGNIDMAMEEIAWYNIAPTQTAPVITNLQPTLLQNFSWGLVPFWAKDTKNAGKMINARAEGIETKPSFRQPIQHKRCLVIADSFYEWRKENGQKQPYRIMLKTEDLLILAGIWEEWRGNEQTINSFSIITTTPNQEMAALHDRMPVVLPDRTTQQQWLSDMPLQAVLAMLITPPNDILTYYPVSPAMNKVSFDEPSIHFPIY